MGVSRIASFAGYLLVTVVTIVGIAATSPRGASHPTLLVAPPVFTLTEPGPAVAYLAAYARGDEVTADQLASPLYRAQWSRLGLSPADRQALLPASQRSGLPPEWLHFNYVGGAVDSRGFGHLLYQARSNDPGRPSRPSAWRLDTDRAGRVIWAEMVFLFSPEVTAVTTVIGENVASRLPGLEPSGSIHPRLIAGLQALGGREGYYAVVVPLAGTAPSATPPDAGSVAFFAVDAEGGTRPGAWTYGQASNRPSEYGREPIPPMVALDPESARLEFSYLQALW
jgi:hypothetical protein